MRYYKKPLPKFSDENVWKDLKRQCYDGTINYEDFPADEYKYFDRLRFIYLQFKFDNMPKEAAVEQEKQIFAEYSLSKEKAARSLKVYRQYQENIKRLEILEIKVNKATSPADKLKYALEIIGIIVGDESFVNRNILEWSDNNE